METNQNNKLKRNIMTAVLVIMVLAIVSMMCFLCVKMNQLEKNLTVIQARLEGQKDNEAFDSVKQQSNLSGETTSVSSTDAEQVVSSAIVAERPIDISGAEPEASHKVYLTFDDGPSKNTEKILDILDEYGVKATFFVVGKEGEENAERLRMICERGHTIGMHSYSHDYSEIYESVEAFRADFLESKQYIYDATGVETMHYRFPGGSSNALSDLSMQVFIDFLKEQGMEYYDWNVSSGDGAGIVVPAEVILENCTAKLSRYDTAIVLMHDSAAKSTTVEALPQIIETILAMEDTVILPITENTQPIHHAIKIKEMPKEETATEEAEELKEEAVKEESDEKEADEEEPKKEEVTEETQETESTEKEEQTIVEQTNDRKQEEKLEQEKEDVTEHQEETEE